MKRTSDTHPIRADFIKSTEFPVLNQIGMTFAPGKKQGNPVSGAAWDRDLRKDLQFLKLKYDTDILVSLIETAEYEELQINSLWSECYSAGIHQRSYPIPDQKIPSDPAEFRDEIKELVRQLELGKRIVIHCKGGLGRTGVAAACIAVAASNGDISGEEAIRLVRDARPGAIENALQEEYVRSFSRHWLSRRTELEFLLPQREANENEEIFAAGGFGDGVVIRRFRASDGKWYFYGAYAGIFPEKMFDEDERAGVNWVKEPVGTFSQALGDVFGDGTLFSFYISKINPDYEQELRAFAELRLAELDEEEKAFHNGDAEAPLTVESWMERSARFRESFNSAADDEMTQVPSSATGASQTVTDGRDFLLYWKLQSIVSMAATGHPLDVISSRQLVRVNVGDRIWVATVDGDGRLLVAGGMKVGRIVDRADAVAELGDTSLWNGEYYALAAEDASTEPIHVVDVHHLVPSLRHGSDGSGRFQLERGRIETRELQSMLELTAESAAMISDAWYSSLPDTVDPDDESSPETEEEIREFISRMTGELAANPENADGWYALGVAYNRLGELAREIECYNKALLIDPEHEASRFDLGCAYSADGENLKARDEFQVLADARSGYAPAYFMLGTMEGRIGNHEAAIDAFRRGLDLDSSDPGAYINMAENYMVTRRFPEAVEALETACDLWPDNADPYYMMGLCHRETGDKRAELEAYLEAVERNGMVVDYLFAAGTAWAHLNGGDEGGDVEYYFCGSDLDLTEPRNFYYMGLGMLALGDITAAEDNRDTLVEMKSELAGRLERFISLAKSRD